MKERYFTKNTDRSKKTTSMTLPLPISPMPTPTSTSTQDLTLNQKPGSCTLRLDTLPFLSTTQKTALISSISNDIAATFIYIAKATETGLLDPTHTESLRKVTRTITDTEIACSRRKRRDVKIVRRYRSRLRNYKRMFRQKMQWARKEFGRFVHRTESILRLQGRRLSE